MTYDEVAMDVDVKVEEATAVGAPEAETTTEDRKVRPAPRGMTLVEIMVVIGIIGTITVVLASGVLSSSDRANEDAANLLLKNISTQLDMHAARAKDKRFPDSLQVLVEGELLGADQLNDPWGTPLSYSTSGRNYELCSGGPDGSIGGGDDICIASTRRK